MRKAIRSNAPLMLIDIDILLKICKILQEDGFIDLYFLIQVWFRFQTKESLMKLLNNLDWTKLHEVVEPFVNLECRVFYKFLDHNIKVGVKGALCYEASRHLIQGTNPTYYIQILRDISDHDYLSFLAYHVFHSLYDQSSLKHNANRLHQKISSSSEFRSKFVDNCNSLKGRYRKYSLFYYGPPDIFPQNGVCSFFVSGNSHNLDPHGLGCTYDEILNCICSECMLLMVFFKIFRGY